MYSSASYAHLLSYLAFAACKLVLVCAGPRLVAWPGVRMLLRIVSCLLLMFYAFVLHINLLCDPFWLKGPNGNLLLLFFPFCGAEYVPL